MDRALVLVVSMTCAGNFSDRLRAEQRSRRTQTSGSVTQPISSIPVLSFAPALCILFLVTAYSRRYVCVFCVWMRLRLLTKRAYKDSNSHLALGAIEAVMTMTMRDIDRKKRNVSLHLYHATHRGEDKCSMYLE